MFVLVSLLMQLVSFSSIVFVSYQCFLDFILFKVVSLRDFLSFAGTAHHTVTHIHTCGHSAAPLEL